MALSLNAEQRKQRARIAGLAARAKGKTNTGPARAASNGRFRKQVIEQAEAEGETLSEKEIDRRADTARRQFYAQMAFKSLAKRRQKAMKKRKSR